MLSVFICPFLFPTGRHNDRAHREPPNGLSSASGRTATGRRYGYSRRRNRSLHPCFKTVRASYPAHGSSVLRLLSRVPLRACGLFCHAFAPCEAHPYLTLPPVHSVYGATGSDHLRNTVPMSAYLAAFPQALASWGMPPLCRIRLTPPPEGERHRVTPFLLSVWR